MCLDNRAYQIVPVRCVALKKEEDIGKNKEVGGL